MPTDGDEGGEKCIMKQFWFREKFEMELPPVVYCVETDDQLETCTSVFQFIKLAESWSTHSIPTPPKVKEEFLSHVKKDGKHDLSWLLQEDIDEEIKEEIKRLQIIENHE